MCAKKLGSMPKEMQISLDKDLFNEKFFPHLESVHSYEVYYGGSGSGKSTFVGQKLALQMTMLPGRNMVCLRRQKTDCLTSCWSEIYNALTKFKLKQYWQIKENPNHVMINRINGNEIIFEGVDNIEDIKSIKFTSKVDGIPGDNNLTDVWYEEANAEPTSSAIDELDRRLRDRFIKTRIIISFNPVSRASWLFEYVTVHLAVKGVDSLILHSTYKDNKFLPKEYGEKLERMKHSNPYDYMVYALGLWGTMGQTVFDANKIQAQLDKIVAMQFTAGDFFYTKENKIPNKDSYKFTPNSNGYTVIFKEPIPKHPYVMAIDTAGEGSDYYVAQVMDNITGEQVARFKNNTGPDECLWQCIGLAIKYNYALIAPEVNFDTWAIKALQMIDYPNIYIRKTPEDKKKEKYTDRLGWRTQPDNRQMMLTDFVYWSGENMSCIYDVDTLNDMLTFTRQDKKLKGIWWGAEPGANDDTVMAFAIMLQARSQQSCVMIADMVKLDGYWTREELESALDEGRISYWQKEQYTKTYGYYAEENEERVERGSRYVRR